MSHRLVLALALLLGPLAIVQSPAHAADPTMALSEVRAGMRCTALSVIRGTAISAFDAEVLEIVRGEAAAPGARILIRVSGPAVDATGIGQGFSGSPILCPGRDGVRRNAGAISEGVGDYGNKVVLVTPIEEILAEAPDAPPGARADAALRRSARRLTTPLTVAGLSPDVRRRLSRAARRARRIVLAAPGGPLSLGPPVDLRPGASMSAGIAGGDIAVGSIGTVTYRDGPKLWAFGHPIDAVGRRSLPLQEAYVFGVINNPLAQEEATSYKLAVPGRTLGSITNDTQSAAIGRVGPPPRAIPMRVEVRDRDTTRAAGIWTQVSDERHLELGSGLDFVGSLALGQAISQVLRSSPPRTNSSLCVRIRVRETRRRLGFCSDYVEGRKVFEDLSAAMHLVDTFKFGRLTPQAVSVRMSVSRGVSEAFILRAGAPRRVRPGQRIRVRLLLQHRRGGRRRLSFRLRVPHSLRPGVRVLRIRGVVPSSLAQGSEEGLALVLEEEDDAAPTDDEAGPRSILDLRHAIAALSHRDGLRATFAGRGRGRVVLSTRRLLVRGSVGVRIRVARRARR